MALENNEVLNNLIQQRIEVEKQVNEGSQQLDQLRATFLKLTGAIDVLSQIEQENNPQPPVEEGAPETAVSEEVPE
jgi:uncharacterized protein YaaN involved in tellurite resistance